MFSTLRFSLSRFGLLLVSLSAIIGFGQTPSGDYQSELAAARQEVIQRIPSPFNSSTWVKPVRAGTASPRS